MINYTLDEKLKYDIPLSEEDRLNITNMIKDSSTAYEKLEKSEELAWEQVENARNLLDLIEENLKSVKSAKQAREAFFNAVENSYFER